MPNNNQRSTKPLHKQPYSKLGYSNKDSARPIPEFCSYTPNYHTIDTIQDHIKELKQDGVWEDLVEYIRNPCGDPNEEAAIRRRTIIEEVAYEISDTTPRLAIDALVCATKLQIFGRLSLHDYAVRNGCTPEGFSKRVDDLCRRLGLPNPSAE